MTEARVEPIEPDPWLASSFLQQAKRFSSDALQQGLALESRQLLVHNAAIAACDAVLAIEGRQVVGADGGHRLRLEEVSRILGSDHSRLFEQLDVARVSRNQVSYAATRLPAGKSDVTTAAVTELVQLADQHVAPHLPEWHDGSEPPADGPA